jgi:AcrR family transcriptional regulator
VAGVRICQDVRLCGGVLRQMKLIENSTMRLRELNKQRTRETILRVAADLFVAQGYQATTLAEIAAAAGVAPSTLHTYFPVKDDLVFSILDVVTESASRRLLARPTEEPAMVAIPAWVAEDLPDVSVQYGADYLVHIHEVMSSDPELWIQRRFRLTLLQEVFAAAFATDCNASTSPLPAKVMAAIALHVIEEVFDVWREWYTHNATSNDAALAALNALTTAHMRNLLEGSIEAVELLPRVAPGGLDFPGAKGA